MEVKLLEDADNDLLYWKKTGNVAIQKKINQLLNSIQENLMLELASLKR